MQPSFSEKITILRPITEVFEFTSNFHNAPKINDSIKKIEKLTEGPIGVGTKFKETKEIRGRNAEATIEVVQYNPTKNYSIRSEANGLGVTYHYQFEEVAYGTLVEFLCEIKTKGLVMALTKPLIVKMLKQEDSDHLKNLKLALERKDPQ